MWEWISDFLCAFDQGTILMMFWYDGSSIIRQPVGAIQFFQSIWKKIHILFVKWKINIYLSLPVTYKLFEISTFWYAFIQKILDLEAF